MLVNEMMRPTFWLAALQIMGINILLSGDNAVVIALAVRALPPRERFWGMVLGAGCAAVLLILFTGIVATLLKLPYLKLIGGLALFWVAVKLVAPQPHDAEDTPEAVEDLWRAVRVVVIANIVMSLDNVIAVAAAAKGDYLLLGLGLAVSIPVVIAGSALFLALLERFPWVVWAGGALLGWIAGGLLPDDAFIAQYIARAYGVPVVPSLWPDAQAISEGLAAATKFSLEADYSWLGSAGRLMLDVELDPIGLACGILGAIFVVVMGLYLVHSNSAAESKPAPSAKSAS
ncbi:MAG TPA: TerC family protein [Xanthobacteraceae bacterium]|jgi:YjbE family integral membrane protein|nr:TerC family protein [Xanthobacteraceae bacterium]